MAKGVGSAVRDLSSNPVSTSMILATIPRLPEPQAPHLEGADGVVGLLRECTGRGQLTVAVSVIIIDMTEAT